MLGATVLRVADLAASVEWFRAALAVEPLFVGSDGEHPIASFALGPSIVSLWQLPPGERRPRDAAGTTSYLVFVHADPAAVHARLSARGVAVGALRRSTRHSFFWFHDPDGNRFEVASPPG